MRAIVLAGLTGVLAGCATGERLTGDGRTEHQIVCGYALPWSLCENRAAELCPAGYTVVSKEWDAMSGSEMWVRCSAAAASEAPG
jgi:hypothetical protein